MRRLWLLLLDWFEEHVHSFRSELELKADPQDEVKLPNNPPQPEADVPDPVIKVDAPQQGLDEVVSKPTPTISQPVVPEPSPQEQTIIVRAVPKESTEPLVTKLPDTAENSDAMDVNAPAISKENEAALPVLSKDDTQDAANVTVKSEETQTEEEQNTNSSEPEIPSFRYGHHQSY